MAARRGRRGAGGRTARGVMGFRHLHGYHMPDLIFMASMGPVEYIELYDGTSGNFAAQNLWLFVAVLRELRSLRKVGALASQKASGISPPRRREIQMTGYGANVQSRLYINAANYTSMCNIIADVSFSFFVFSSEKCKIRCVYTYINIKRAVAG